MGDLNTNDIIQDFDTAYHALKAAVRKMDLLMKPHNFADMKLFIRANLIRSTLEDLSEAIDAEWEGRTGA